MYYAIAMRGAACVCRGAGFDIHRGGNGKHGVYHLLPSSVYIILLDVQTGNRTESTATNAVTTYNLTSLSWNEIIEKDCSNRNSLPCRSSHQLIVRDNRLVHLRVRCGLSSKGDLRSVLSV